MFDGMFGNSLELDYEEDVQFGLCMSCFRELLDTLSIVGLERCLQWNALCI